jgi:hypothetical protein
MAFYRELNKTFYISFFTVGLFSYLSLTKGIGLFTIFLFITFFVLVKFLKGNKAELSYEILLPIIASLFLLRAVVSNSQLELISYGMLALIWFYIFRAIAMDGFRLAVFYSPIWRDASILLFAISFPLAISSRTLPGSQFSWLLGGDGNNWFVLHRILKVKQDSSLVDLIMFTSGSPIMANIFNPYSSKDPKTSFSNDLITLLNFQMVCTFIFVLLILSYLDKKRTSLPVKIFAGLALILFGSLLGYAQYNGFLTILPAMLLLISLWSLASQITRFSVKYVVVLHLALFVLAMFVWSLLAPVVLVQAVYLLGKRHFLILKPHLFLLVPLAGFLYVVVGAIVLKKLDTNRGLTIERGGMWQSPLMEIILFTLVLLLLMAHFSGVNIFNVFFQTVATLLTCQLLFQTYDIPSIWGPWTSYYPQKLLTVFFLSLAIWLIVQIVATRIERFTQIVLLSLLFTNFWLQTPNVLLDKLKIAYDSSSATQLQIDTAAAITFVSQKAQSQETFAFWNKFSWPAESSANAWAGLAWEKYPGNWSMPNHDGTFTANNSGPVGNRAYHNGNQNDNSNLCRLSDLLPENSIIYSNNLKETKAALKMCKDVKQIEVRAF